MSNHHSTLEHLREGSDEFQRALTSLEGVTEEDEFETLTDEEVRTLAAQLEGNESEQ